MAPARKTARRNGRPAISAENNRGAGVPSLVELDRARQTLVSTTDVHVVKELRDMAETVRKHFSSSAGALARQEEAGAGDIPELKARVAEAFTIQQQAAEVKLRAERRLGQLLGGSRLRGGDRRSGVRSADSKLRNWGVSKDQSRRCQRIASVSDADFESYIASSLQQQRELTSSALLRLAARNTGRDGSSVTDRTLPRFAEVGEQLAEFVTQGVTFSCLYLSPPWPAVTGQLPRVTPEFEAGSVRRFMQSLAALPIREVCALRAHLHLRTPWEWHFRAAKIMHGWGFTCRSAAVIPVRPRAYGDYWRTAYDLLLLGVRGRLSFRDTSVVGWLGSHGDLADVPDADICEAIARVSPGPYLTVLGTDCPAGWTAVTDE